MIDPLGPNAACYVCHTTFVWEELSKVHLSEKVTCIECHGLSAGHANDENIGATPPDRVYKRHQVDISCQECHEDHNVPAREVIARWLQRKRPKAPICTDCHGTHKIERPEGDNAKEAGADAKRQGPLRACPAVPGRAGQPWSASATTHMEGDRMATRLARYALIAAIATVGPAARAVTAPEPRYPIPNKYEEEAIAAGQRLGIGSATLEGPKTIEVMSYGTWTLVYTAGKAGIRPGGGIRIGFRHVAQWSQPQTKDPKGLGYLTAKTSRDSPVQVDIDFRRRFFLEHFAWQNMVEVILPEEGLGPGETLRVTYGDRSGGSPGIRVQPFDERRFVFKVYVDALSTGRWLPLAESPAIEVVGAEPYRLAVVMPSDAVAGEPTWYIVRAEDRYGNPATGYRGTIRCRAVRSDRIQAVSHGRDPMNRVTTSAVTQPLARATDAGAALAAEYTFTEADAGVHRFEPVTFAEPGVHMISVTDGSFQATGNPVRVVVERPERLLLWGDLHGHTLQSDGRGTVEEYYDFAEHFSGLDFCAVSDHAFELVDEMWAHSKAVTNARYRPGRFVTFNAYEWSGNADVGGDHNVYFLEDDPPIYRSDNYYDPRNLQMDHGPEPKVAHVEELFARLEARLDDKDVLCIPHWGGRHGSPRWHNPKVERLIEIFSEHRRSEDWAATFLAQGHRVGIMASTDDHYGNPGYGYLRPSYEWDRQEIGMAAVAVYAARRTRESIFRALYDRHTYATTGDRIILRFGCQGHTMGSDVRTTTSPGFEIEAVGTADVAQILVNKDGKVVRTQSYPPGTRVARLRYRDRDFQPGRASYYYVRVCQTNDEEAVSSPIWVN